MLTRGFRSANKTIFRWFDAIVVIGRDMSRKIIRAEDVGWVAPPEDPVAIAAAITEAASNSGSTARKAYRAVEIASHHTSEIALGSYRRLMDTLLKR
ncbi:hypothetical protein [Bradyrhizobium sp. JYMT SZCCT0180]|uniref:hypothetical protein n=1 Tax=Bradyrhizobium sp. JYMT SZCCT0180 TaxID=2807666 RepID=UPI001BA5C874|nr:hypothetical protein [Bradyrhizobium sp. JYMT SZCCT0180]MBR1214341.1 hypothetical protein [Bradyrhizobium sp. JYMT SZCCT0180]